MVDDLLERRLREHLVAAAEDVEVAPKDPWEIVRVVRGRRRRSARLLAAAVVILAGVSGAVAWWTGEESTVDGVETVDRPAVEDGVAVPIQLVEHVEAIDLPAVRPVSFAGAVWSIVSIDVDEGVVSRSTDGFRWTPVAGFPADLRPVALAAGGDEIVVLVRGDAGLAAVASTDGESWTMSTPFDGTAIEGTDGTVGALDTGFAVVAHHVTPTNRIRLWTSGDGIAWTPAEIPQEVADSGLVDSDLGIATLRADGGLWLSTDGEAWTALLRAPGWLDSEDLSPPAGRIVVSEFGTYAVSGEIWRSDTPSSHFAPLDSDVGDSPLSLVVAPSAVVTLAVNDRAGTASLHVSTDGQDFAEYPFDLHDSVGPGAVRGHALRATPDGDVLVLITTSETTFVYRAELPASRVQATQTNAYDLGGGASLLLNYMPNRDTFCVQPSGGGVVCGGPGNDGIGFIGSSTNAGAGSPTVHYSVVPAAALTVVRDDGTAADAIALPAPYSDFRIAMFTSGQGGLRALDAEGNEIASDPTSP